MPLDFEPQRADPALKGLLYEEDRDGKIIKYGVHFDAFDKNGVPNNKFGENYVDRYKFDYVQIGKDLQKYKAEGDREKYLKIIRVLAPKDLFFLMYFVLNLPMNHPFLIARAYEAQAKRDMTLDLWARGHWKSSIRTFAQPIHELIMNPNERISIFSHTAAAAKSHLRRIQTNLEDCVDLLDAFPHIFHRYPRSQATKWSELNGLYVKRKSGYSPQEASIEAMGLDNLFTGKHYSIMIYDDIIDLRKVSTARQQDKAIEQVQQSDNLGDTVRPPIKRGIGTRYSKRDAWQPWIESKLWTKYIYPAEVDKKGVRKFRSTPVYMDRETLDEKFELQLEFTYSCQMLQDPIAESRQTFKINWLKYWENKRPFMNYYVLVDSAREKEKRHDYTVMTVIGLDSLRNYWWVDGIRDKLDLGEKWTKLRDLVQQWQPLMVGYERVGAMTDDQYMAQMMQTEGIFFNIMPLGVKSIPKDDRIKRLIPLWQKGRFIIPRTLPYFQEWNKTTVDLTHEFIEKEYAAFPFAEWDDTLDNMAKILDVDLKAIFPVASQARQMSEDIPPGDPLNQGKQEQIRHWMAR